MIILSWNNYNVYFDIYNTNVSVRNVLYNKQINQISVTILKFGLIKTDNER